MNNRPILAARTALALAAAAALGSLPATSWALGLGRLNVQSALGEGLRAEIDVTSLSAEEAASLAVRIASPEAYRAAGVDYNPVLAATQAVLMRRADGRPYLRVISDRAVQEPFVDVILEMQWSSGRLVREFTLLFDPPSNRAAPPVQAAAPVAPAVTPASPNAQNVPAPAAQPPVAAAPAPRAAQRPAPMPSPAPLPQAAAAPARPTLSADDYRVRPGDSLSRIASRTQRPGVVLDQMLVSLYRANPDAFIGNNMNRLRAGVVLNVPSADAVKAIAPGEARQVIAAQSADFGAYRQRLAQGVSTAATDTAARQASGKVQGSVDDKKQAAATSPDKLKLSGATKPSAQAEPQASKASESKDAAARVAELSRNVEELKKVQQGTAAAQPGPAPAPAPATAAAPAPAPVVVPPIAVPAPAPVTPPAPVPAPAPAPVVAEAASAKPIDQPAVAPKPAPSSAAEPGFFESLTDSPYLLPGIGALALVLAGLGYYRMRGKGGRKDRTETSFLESRVQPDSFFGASGGQRVDTTDQSAGTSSMGFSISQLDAIGDVDPVAEADVYLAYGRDLQAEEILKEAMRTNPERLAVRTKLLEVYAKRRDTKGFELLATQLFALTKGEGDDWAKAQALGSAVDPDNKLYQPGGSPPQVIKDGARVFVEPLGASTLPYSVAPSPSMFPGSEHGGPGDSLSMDLDLDLGAPPQSMEATRPLATGAVPAAASSGLDFDFSQPAPLAPTPPPAASTPSHAPASAAPLLAPMFNLDDTIPGRPSKKPDPALDFGDFRLSDSAPLSESVPLSEPMPLRDSEMPDNLDPMARKLELAEEFRQIGDIDGARDLLEEVIGRSSGALKAKAQGMLEDLG